MLAMFHPNAKVLCGRCHPLSPNDATGHIHPVTCDQCGAVAKCRREDVSQTQSAMHALRASGITCSLTQTGGMTCNLLVPLPNGEYLLALWENDFLTAIYADEDTASDPVCEVGTIPAATFVEVVKRLAITPEKTARQVVAIVSPAHAAMPWPVLRDWLIEHGYEQLVAAVDTTNPNRST
jgi:hypothetical protein